MEYEVRKMLQAKIKLTDLMIHNIKTARIAKRIPAAVLSRAIKRDDSYISSLELKRLRTISADDLIAILSFLFEIPEHMAIAKAEEFIGIVEKPNSYLNSGSQDSFSPGGNEGAMWVSEPVVNDYQYDTKSAYAGLELINDMLEVLIGLITDIYKKEPKEVFFVLSSFVKTLQFDPVFTMSVMGIPFFALKSLSIDKRKDVLDELLSVFSKYAAITDEDNT
jgi:hypothetical protein